MTAGAGPRHRQRWHRAEPRHAGRRQPGRSICRPRSPPWARKAPAPRPPTGRRSSRCTSCSGRPRTIPRSRSTTRSRPPWSTAPAPGCSCSTSSPTTRESQPGTASTQCAPNCSIWPASPAFPHRPDRPRAPAVGRPAAPAHPHRATRRPSRNLLRQALLPGRRPAALPRRLETRPVHLRLALKPRKPISLPAQSQKGGPQRFSMNGGLSVTPCRAGEDAPPGRPRQPARHGQRPPPGLRPMAVARLRSADLPLATVST